MPDKKVGNEIACCQPCRISACFSDELEPAHVVAIRMTVAFVY